MEFGKWELRDNSYTGYYFSKDSMIYPSGNATDSGKLHTEENVRNIYRDLTTKNFVTKNNYFSLSINTNRNGIIVSPGEAVIQGYHFYAKNMIEVRVPDNTQYNDDGTIKDEQKIEQYTLGISLSYDAANHVTGDVVNKEAEIGESEVLSGVYVAWFNECELESNYENILVLGRAWIQEGIIIQDGTIVDNKRIVYHGFETDPFKDHKFEGKTVEIEVNGHKLTKYDTLRDNMTQIHESLYSYDSMHFPIELDRRDRTKPPSFVTDIQDYINHLPDWYTSKYGDYMTGALRFNNLSIDAKRDLEELKESNIIKDSVENDFSDSVFISPRTYGDLVRNFDNESALKEYNYDVGGTIMTIVPGTYKNSTDYNNGYTGIHAALVAQKYGETGLRIHYGNGDESGITNTTRLVHYNSNDNQTHNNKEITNTSKFIIENIDNDGRKASIDIKNGEIFIDSFTSPNNEAKNNCYQSGIQFYVSGDTTESSNNIDFRIDESCISMAKHEYTNHRTGTRGTQQLGKYNDDLYFTVGVGIDEYGTTKNNFDPYMTLGNLRIRSNTVKHINESDTKQTIIELLCNKDLPFINIKPRIYSEQIVSRDLIQVGSYSEILKNDTVQDNTHDRIVMKKINSDSHITTYFEQDYYSDNKQRVLNKMMPPINNTCIPKFNEISGMLSTGNIGCSSKEISVGSSTEDISRIENDNYNYNPYTNDSEWVRFTRFRYDLDRDQINGGTNDTAHDSNKGRQWGDTYNIEFNTNVANRRANQIIWRYNGSINAQTDDLQYTPPVILSYIHDNPNDGNNKANATKYTNVEGAEGYYDGKGTYETWTDHNGVPQYNPTYKTRDFLLLENAGLVVTGDINNPSLFSNPDDKLIEYNHLGVTIVGGRVYNAVYNDFAETFEKDNMREFAKPGDLIALNPETGKYIINDKYENKMIVGIQSNSYAYLAGGNRINNAQDAIMLDHEYFTVAVSGKVWVNVIENSDIKAGDMLMASSEKGKATKSINNIPGTIVGKALCEPKYFEKEKEYKVLVLVMTA